MLDREFAAVSRLSGDVLMVYEGTYQTALDVFARQFGTEVDYVVERLQCWNDPPQQAYQESRF